MVSRFLPRSQCMRKALGSLKPCLLQPVSHYVSHFSATFFPAEEDWVSISRSIRSKGRYPEYPEYPELHAHLVSQMSPRRLHLLTSSTCLRVSHNFSCLPTRVLSTPRLPSLSPFHRSSLQQPLASAHLRCVFNHALRGRRCRTTGGYHNTWPFAWVN